MKTVGADRPPGRCRIWALAALRTASSKVRCWCPGRGEELADEIERLARTDDGRSEVAGVVAVRGDHHYGLWCSGS